MRGMFTSVCITQFGRFEYTINLRLLMRLIVILVELLKVNANEFIQKMVCSRRSFIDLYIGVFGFYPSATSGPRSKRFDIVVSA